MKKYTATLRDRTDYKLAIEWCEKVLPMNTVTPIHDRKKLVGQAGVRTIISQKMELYF